MIFVKTHFNAEIYDYLENNIVKISLKINNIPMILLCIIYIVIYKSPSIDNDSLTISLKEAFNGLNFDSNLITIIGEMNFNIIGSHINNNDYLDIFLVTVSFLFINDITNLHKGQQHSCIDHIVFIKSNNINTFNEINAGVLLTDITDHCSI